MSTNPRTRWVFVSVVLALASALAGAFAARDAIRETWHFYQLREHPERLEEALLADHPALRGAAARFLATEGGRQTFLELFLDEFGRTKWTGNTLFQLTQVERTDLAGGVLAIMESGYSMRTEWGAARRPSQASMGLPPDDPVRRERVIEALASVEGYTGRSARFPRLEFRFERLASDGSYSNEWDEASAASRFPPTRRPPPWSEQRKTVEHICLFRVLAAPNDQATAPQAFGSGAPPRARSGPGSGGDARGGPPAEEYVPPSRSSSRATFKPRTSATRPAESSS